MCSECKEANCPYRQNGKKKTNVTNIIALIAIVVIVITVLVSAIAHHEEVQASTQEQTTAQDTVDVEDAAESTVQANEKTDEL